MSPRAKSSSKGNVTAEMLSSVTLPEEVVRRAQVVAATNVSQSELRGVLEALGIFRRTHRG